ncbi:hypothetical protein L3Y34_017583 [Caenorhabditis briggsae]|uniref:GYF domain-containing protein n=1 Tax=Caenorhabditis briggsae TaxID=6238 RepID=A0AAE9ITS4_CAEBR|nr:hypothetical protein L3Y34_017583 [Caenorhabditis briggsae]
MSSVSSAEPTAQQNFNPSWMRTNSVNRGGSISSGGHRLSGIGGGGYDDGDKLQHNINSSKAMSLLSHADRASIAAGAAYGSGYGGGIGSPSIQNGQSTTNRWTPKSSWSKTPERSVGGATRAGSTVGRASGTFFAGRGGTRTGTENGYGGPINGSPAGSTDEAIGTYQSKFNSVRRGGGVGSVGRGGSTTGASFNTRADALYNPNDPTDRPKAVNVAATRSESDDEEEEGWSKVGATSRSSTNTAPSSSDRPAWARSESWIQRTQQQQQQQNSQQPPSTAQWNNRDSGSDSAVWRDRNQMVAAVKKNSGENPSPPLQSQQNSSAPTSAQPREESQNSDLSHLSSYQPDASTWSNSNMGGGMGVFFQPNLSGGSTPSSASGPAPVVKEEPVEFYYMDPTETRRGPFHKDQMTVWFKAGYFTDETLRVQRGEKGEYKTIGELKKIHGATTPFEYPEDVEKPHVPIPPPTSVASIPSYPSTTNPMFPSAPYGGMNMWSSMQILAERQRLAEEHNRRMQEEAEKMAKFHEAMYRQLSLQQEMSQQQIREQELALQRHREELEKRDAELKREALARQQQIEMEAREVEQRRAAIEAEALRKKESEEHARRVFEEKQREAAAAKKLAEQRSRQAQEAADRENNRLAEEAKRAAEVIQRIQRGDELKQKAAEEEKKRIAENERIAREAAKQAQLDAIWASPKAPVVSTSSNPVTTGVPKQVSPSGSDDSEGWTAITKEVKHTKPAPWAAKTTEAPQKSEKTLMEIQLEEERKMKAEQERNAKQKAKEQSSTAATTVISPEKSGGLWGATKTWAAPEANNSKAYVSPFLDGPSLEAANKMALQKKSSQSKIVVTKPAAAKPAPAPAKAKAAAQPPAEKTKKSKEQVASDAFQDWFIQKFRTFSTQLDAPTLYACILTLENPNEVEDIVMSYLDESKAVKEFVREFLKRRIAMRAAGGAAHPDADDLTSARAAAAAPSDSNSGSNSNSGNGQGKKKKKTQKQVLDGNILGFRGTAASDRLNKGEIDAIPTAPVNPSRR